MKNIKFGNKNINKLKFNLKNKKYFNKKIGFKIIESWN